MSSCTNREALKAVIAMKDLKNKPHCRRCDLDRGSLIKFLTPDNRPYYLCDACVAQEDQRQLRFSPTWKRARRPITPVEVLQR